ncbi:MAG: Sec-independent protein translocase protein TatB [Pyrinomonadaceae bacterium]
MFLFILESIGTSELVLIGIVALVFLGPRKLPEIARKIGKITAEFRGTASEFKQTWEREADFEEEAKAFDLNELEAEPVAREKAGITGETVAAPVIRELDADDYKHMIPAETAIDAANPDPVPAESIAGSTEDKKNWL